MRFKSKSQSGFSLIELSIVLLVLGLILTSTITGLSDLVWRARNAQAKKDLSLAKEALIGYVISKGRLPCADTDGFEGNVNVPASPGEPDDDGSGGCDNNGWGYLPWAELGVNARDPWGNLYYYRVLEEYADDSVAPDTVTFTLTESDGSMKVLDTAGGTTVANYLAAVFFSVGPNGITSVADAAADEVENLNATQEFVDRPFSGPETSSPFDDIVQWLPTFTLKAKMVEAERLPE